MLAKLRKPVIILAALLLLYAVIGFFIIPAVIQSQGPKMLTEKIGRPVSLPRATFNPFTLSMTLEEFQIDETDGQKILAFDRLLIDFTLRSLLRRTMDFEKVHLTAPYVWVDIFANGHLNLLELLPEKSDEEEPEDENQKPFPVWIDDLKIENGHVRFDDLSHKTPFEANITPINLHFKNLTTLTVEGGTDTLTTELQAGGRLNWTGTLSLNPLLAKGHMQLTDVSMPKVWEYLEDRFHFQFARGALTLDADLLFNASGKTPELQVSNGTAALEQFLLTEKGAEDALIEIPQVAVDGIEFDLAKQRLAVASVTSKGARLKGWRNIVDMPRRHSARIE